MNERPVLYLQRDDFSLEASLGVIESFLQRLLLGLHGFQLVQQRFLGGPQLVDLVLVLEHLLHRHLAEHRHNTVSFRTAPTSPH